MTFLNKGLDKIDKALNSLAAITLLIMMLLIVTDVLARAFFNSPIEGVLEITGEYLLLSIVFFSISYTYKVGGHVRVEIIFDMFSDTIKKIVKLLTDLLIIGILALLAYTNILRGFDYHAKGVTTNSLLEYPLAPAYFIIFIGIILLILRLILEVIQIAMGKKAGNEL